MALEVSVVGFVDEEGKEERGREVEEEEGGEEKQEGEE